tara:strand:- start:137 stop:793 length:657 start_codon:yes stop_codon:yes gene_type:complete
MKCLIGKNTWELLPEKAIHWAEQSTLIVSDIHLGKAGHFRKHGIGVPVDANLENLARLTRLLDQTKAVRLLVLGDLFHSDQNPEWDVFKEWLAAELEGGSLEELLLIQGNHDVLPPAEWNQKGMRIEAALLEDDLFFVHDSQEHEPVGGAWTVCGHVHPAVRLIGGGKQALRVPCWWLNQEKRQLTLPAFGAFTGSFTVKPSRKDTCWVTTGTAILAV